MIDPPTSVLAHLLQLAERYSGRQARPENRIYADLDINGGDFIEFVVAVERHYGVDLSWVSPRQPEAEAQDPTVEAIARDVLRQQG
jgi:hypothetical protein